MQFIFRLCVSGFKSILLEQTGKISLRVHVLQKCKDGQRIGNLDAESSHPDPLDRSQYRIIL